VADRRSVFTDARIIKASRDFTCVADEIWRLQRGSEADCIFFQRCVNDGERITDRGSYQGTWVLAPSGKLLAHVNTRNIEKQLETMRAGLLAWEQLSRAERHLKPGAEFRPAHRWEQNYPQQGLALERFGRELGPEGLAGEPLPSWNVDYAWASQAELQRQVDDERPLLNAQTGAPNVSAFGSLARRLAKFHLIDNVRGQSIPFAADEVSVAELTGTWTARTKDEIQMSLLGHTRAVADGTWRMGDNSWKPKSPIPHGMTCDLAGEATWSVGEQRFTHFELVAAGKRWGRTQNNGRSRDPSPGRIAFHFEIPRNQRRVAPTFISAYDVDWVRRPVVQEWVYSPSECGLDGAAHK